MVILCQVGKLRRGEVTFTFGDMSPVFGESGPVPDALLPKVVTLDAAASLREAVLGLTHLRVDRAATVPRIKWSGVPNPSRGPWLWVLGLLLLFVGAYTGWYFLVLPALVMALAVRLAPVTRGMQPPRVIDSRGGEVLVSMVEARLSPVAELRPDRPLTALERVRHVQSELGRLTTDICYRIENSALFDGAVPTTQRFQLALLAWDPGATDVEALATEVEESFDAARRHAESLGLGHLPETARPDGERALKAARTALGSELPGEQRAARERVADLLGSLALYYLPHVDPTAPALVGERKAIEPGA